MFIVALVTWGDLSNINDMFIVALFVSIDAALDHLDLHGCRGLDPRGPGDDLP